MLIFNQKIDNQNKNSDTFGFVVSEKPGNTAHLRDETTELPCINTTDISSGEVCENAFAQSLTSEEKIECFRQMDVGIENPESKNTLIMNVLHKLLHFYRKISI